LGGTIFRVISESVARLKHLAVLLDARLGSGPYQSA